MGKRGCTWEGIRGLGIILKILGSERDYGDRLRILRLVGGMEIEASWRTRKTWVCITSSGKWLRVDHGG